MRRIVVLLWMTMPSLAFADDGFQQMKSRMTEKLELQMAELQKAQACAVSAKDMADLKKCHFQRKAGLRDLKVKLQTKYGNKPQKEQVAKQVESVEEEFPEDTE
ncbi:MAG: hypothetical protein ACOH5I_07640 [Oligoflexus sp.]